MSAELPTVDDVNDVLDKQTDGEDVVSEKSKISKILTIPSWMTNTLRMTKNPPWMTFTMFLINRQMAKPKKWHWRRGKHPREFSNPDPTSGTRRSAGCRSCKMNSN